MLERELREDQDLPASVLRVCADLHERSLEGESGFRRRNVPALAYRYFRDMAQTFRAVLPILVPNARFALVVGRNRTTLANQEITIDTPRLLGEIGSACGFEIEDVVELDTFQRFDVHSRNSIRSESLVILRRGG
jgi:site-specific DNA-methyltransferase (cytosine-N4-specific)